MRIKTLVIHSVEVDPHDLKRPATRIKCSRKKFAQVPNRHKKDDLNSELV